MSGLLFAQTDNKDQPTEPTWRVLYKAVPSDKSGVTVDGEIVIGLIVVCVSKPGPYNCADEMIQNIPDYSFIFLLENEPIKAGDIFYPIVTNVDTDWESGLVDNWDVEFIRTTILEDDILEEEHK